MSVNCMRCGANERTGGDLLCDVCRKEKHNIPSSLDWTPQQALNEVAALCKDSTSKECPDGVLIIALWNQNDTFDTKFWNVGMKVSELIALLEIQKAKLIECMKRNESE